MKLFTAFFLLVSTSIAAAQEKIGAFTLENGMQGIVIEDHRSPVVTHMVWYKVGAADEGPSETGIAHFFEHLMFKSTKTRRDIDFSRVVEENGGEDNAFTTQDFTAYYQRVAKDRLPLMMELEADRMVNLDLSEEVVATERDVILEERKTRIDQNPSALFQEQLGASTYLNHPYRMPVIGWEHEIAALERDNVLAFYKKYYAPNNAILVVAGDVTLDEVKSLAETYYGKLQPSTAIPKTRTRPIEPEQIAPRRVLFEHPLVRQPYIVRRYIAPERNSGDQKEAAALTVLAEMLGGGQATAYLTQKLQTESKLALAVGAGYSGVSLDLTDFSLYAVPADGVSLEKIEAALDAALTDFLNSPIDENQLARIKAQIRADEIYALDHQEGLANQYGRALASGLTIDDVKAWPEILMSVTADDIKNAAKAVLDIKHSATGWLEQAEG